MFRLTTILRCAKGSSAIEYALVACLISIAALVGISNLGTKVTGMYTGVSAKMPSS